MILKYGFLDKEKTQDTENDLSKCVSDGDGSNSEVSDIEVPGRNRCGDKLVGNHMKLFTYNL